jgi:hypothetical protein
MMGEGYVDIVTETNTYTTGKNKGKTYTTEKLVWYDEDIKKSYNDSIRAMLSHS